MLRTVVTTYTTLLSDDARSFLDAVDLTFGSALSEEGLFTAGMAVVKRLAWGAARLLCTRYNIRNILYATDIQHSMMIMLEGLDLHRIAVDNFLALAFLVMALLIIPVVLHVHAAMLSAAGTGCNAVRVRVFGWWGALPRRVWRLISFFYAVPRRTCTMVFDGMIALMTGLARTCRRVWDMITALAHESWRRLFLALRGPWETIHENTAIPLRDEEGFEAELDEAIRH